MLQTSNLAVLLIVFCSFYFCRSRDPCISPLPQVFRGPPCTSDSDDALPCLGGTSHHKHVFSWLQAGLKQYSTVESLPLGHHNLICSIPIQILLEFLASVDQLATKFGPYSGCLIEVLLISFLHIFYSTPFRWETWVPLTFLHVCNGDEGKGPRSGQRWVVQYGEIGSRFLLGLFNYQYCISFLTCSLVLIP